MEKLLVGLLAALGILVVLALQVGIPALILSYAIELIGPKYGYTQPWSFFEVALVVLVIRFVLRGVVRVNAKAR